MAARVWGIWAGVAGGMLRRCLFVEGWAFQKRVSKFWFGLFDVLGHFLCSRIWSQLKKSLSACSHELLPRKCWKLESRYFGGTVTAVTAGRDWTVKPPSKLFRRPVPPTKSLPLEIIVPSRGDIEQLPPRPAVTPSNYGPVPPWHITVSSRRDTEKLPSRPADKISLVGNYRPVPSWHGLRWT